MHYIMISLVVIIMILHSATTQQWNYTSPVISRNDSNVIFRCPFNQPFINITSTYKLLLGRSWQFHCDNTSLDFPLGTWIPYTAPVTNFTIECPNDYFISGIHFIKVQSPGNDWSWRFYCSATLNKEASFCKWTEPTFVNENFTLSLRGNDTVITRVKAVFDTPHVDYIWSYYRCTLRDICSGFTFPENITVTRVYNNVWKLSCSYGFRLVGQEFINCSYLSLQIPYCKECCGPVPLEGNVKTVCNPAGISLQATCPHGYYITGETEFCSADVNIDYLPFCTECRNGSINYCVEYDCSSETDIRCSQCQPTHPITGLPLIPNKANKKCKTPAIVLSLEIFPDTHYFFGHNWIMTCNVAGSGDVSTHWYFNNTEMEDVWSNQVSINTDNTGPGFVMCKAMNNLGYDIKNISVASVKPIVFHTTNNVILSAIGSTVVLDCVKSGDVDHILWSKEKNVIPTNETRYTILKNTSLRIYSVSLADCGNYKCSVENLMESRMLDIILYVSGLMAGDIGNATTTVVHYGSGMFEPAGIIHWNKSYVVPLGSTIKLYCLVIGFPMPLIVWRKNRLVVFATGVNGYNMTNESQLVLRNVSMATSGKYECLAANIFGMDSEITFVTVTSLYEITSVSHTSLASASHTSLTSISQTSASHTSLTSISHTSASHTSLTSISQTSASHTSLTLGLTYLSLKYHTHFLSCGIKYFNHTILSVYDPHTLTYPTKFHLILLLTIYFVTLFMTVILVLIIYMRNRYCYRYIYRR